MQELLKSLRKRKMRFQKKKLKEDAVGLGAAFTKNSALQFEPTLGQTAAVKQYHLIDI